MAKREKLQDGALKEVLDEHAERALTLLQSINRIYQVQQSPDHQIKTLVLYLNQPLRTSKVHILAFTDGEVPDELKIEFDGKLASNDKTKKMECAAVISLGDFRDRIVEAYRNVFEHGIIVVGLEKSEVAKAKAMILQSFPNQKFL